MPSQTEFARQQMIDQQLRTSDVSDARVLCAFDEIPRERFVPARFRGLAFADTEIPLGHGERMMTPMIEGRLLQALAPQPTERVLEIGTGSGWLTALLATLAGEVLSIDRVADFADGARRRLVETGVGNVTVETRDAATLRTESSRFDVIAVTGSLPAYDPLFESLLEPGGRLFMVVGDGPAMEARLVARGAGAGTHAHTLFETRLEPLRGFAAPSRFAL